MPDLDAVSWELVIAGAAFVLSLYAASREWRERREAMVEVRWERVPDPNGSRTPHNYLVIHNRGPATATDVRVKPLTKADGPVNLVDPDVLPIPRLYPGQTYHVEIYVIVNAELRRAELAWTDRRRKRQRQDVFVSPRLVLS